MDEFNLVLTTIDNPYNPKTDYDKWKEWDADNGYNTEAFIARLVDMEGYVEDNDDIKIHEVMDNVIHDILEHDVLNIYMLV